MNTACLDKILVVDDAIANLQFLTNVLTEHGYTVYPASDGELALEFVQSTLPDLILLDIRMPGMDGYEVCRRLKAKERTCSIPIIFISILEDERDKVKGFQEGAVDYITKPFQPEEVLARVRLHLRLRELTDYLEHTVAERTTELHAANMQLQRELVERNQAEEALQKERNLLRTLITNMPDYVYVKDRESRFVLANAALLHAFDVATVEELAGKTDFDFLPRNYATKFYTDEQAIIASGEALINCEEQSIELHTGRPVWFSTTKVPLRDAHGYVTGIIGVTRDISDRKRVEEALKRERTLLANIMETSPIGITTVDANGQITFANTQAINILGLTKTEIVQRTYSSPAWHITDFAGNPFPVEELPFARVMATGQAVHDVQHAIEWPDGHRVLLSINAAPLKNEADQIEGMVAVISDITERKRAERELQRSNDLLRAIIEAAPTAIIGLDLDGNVQTVWNPAAEKMLGWSAQEAMGHLLPSVPVENQEEFRSFRKWIRSGQSLNGVEVRRQRRDGSPIDYSIYASPLYDAEGLIIGNVAVLVDITERKQAEEDIRKLSLAVEQSPAAIVITDPAGVIEYVNPRLTHITGYTRDEVIGKNPRIFKSGETPLKEYQRLWENVTHGDVWRGEFHNKKKTGELYWESLSISPVIDSQGNITHFVAVKEDITARKRTEEALRVLNEELELRVSQRTAELEVVNKELQEFAHIVSHDLKAPLRGISRLTQWLQEDYAGALGAQGQEQLHLLGEQVKRMDTLIDGILRYSKAVHGSEREESFDLNTLVSQVIEMLMLPAHITIQCENTLPVIYGDPIQLTQVFQNLLSNAVKFMDKPAGKITVTSEDTGEEWIFRVEDNGPGIEPRHHERIFKIFQSCTARDDRESTGIGLAVVKKIVELYDGRVWVESTPGQGSRFSFTWPKRIRGKD